MRLLLGVPGWFGSTRVTTCEAVLRQLMNSIIEAIVEGLGLFLYIIYNFTVQHVWWVICACVCNKAYYYYYQVIIFHMVITLCTQALVCT